MHCRYHRSRSTEALELVVSPRPRSSESKSPITNFSRSLQLHPDNEWGIVIEDSDGCAAAASASYRHSALGFGIGCSGFKFGSSGRRTLNPEPTPETHQKQKPLRPTPSTKSRFRPLNLSTLAAQSGIC